MNSEPHRFELPARLEQLMSALSGYYAKTGQDELQSVLVNARYRVHEEWDYDNWNGGQWGHALYLKLPPTLYYDVFDRADKVAKSICDGLNRINTVPQEHVAQVFIEPQEAETVEDWRNRSGVLLHAPDTLPTIPSDHLDRIWQEGFFRLFLSHKATHKIEASRLKGELLLKGISAFVAHEDIEPTKEWQDEIEVALFSMDALCALMTPDFADSAWTDQEVGVAIGRRVPILPVRLGLDPYGFIGKFQGLPGLGRSACELASAISAQLWSKPELQLPLTIGLVTAFEGAKSYKQANEIMAHLSRLQTAPPDLIERLERAPGRNSQLQDAFAVKGGLGPLIARLKGREA